jgi:hypothetical protein
MKLTEFLSRAAEMLSEMHLEAGAKQSDIVEMKLSIDLLLEYSNDANAADRSIDDLPSYVSPYRDTITRIERAYQQSSERARQRRFVTSVVSGVSFGKIQTILKETANEAGLLFIPIGRIVIECGSADEITVRPRLRGGPRPTSGQRTRRRGRATHDADAAPREGWMVLSPRGERLTLAAAYRCWAENGHDEIISRQYAEFLERGGTVDEHGRAHGLRATGQRVRNNVLASYRRNPLDGWTVVDPRAGLPDSVTSDLTSVT